MEILIKPTTENNRDDLYDEYEDDHDKSSFVSVGL